MSARSSGDRANRKGRPSGTHASSTTVAYRTAAAELHKRAQSLTSDGLFMRLHEDFKEEARRWAAEFFRSNLQVFASKVAECSALTPKPSLVSSQVSLDKFFDIVEFDRRVNIEGAEIKDYNHYSVTMAVEFGLAAEDLEEVQTQVQGRGAMLFRFRATPCAA